MIDEAFFSLVILCIESISHQGISVHTCSATCLSLVTLATKLLFCTFFTQKGISYSEVPNRRADQNKQAGLEESDTLLAYLLSKLINEQGGIFHFTK